MVRHAVLPSGRGRFRVRWQSVAIALLGVLVVGILAFAIIKPVRVLPRLQLAPGFVLTDQTGDMLSNETLRGSVVLYSFGYARCGERCAATMAEMRRVQGGLSSFEPGGLPVKLVTISFDAERDTPEALSAYARSIGADPAVWRFATGEAARLKQVLGGGFEIYYAPDGAGGFIFDPVLVLADWSGIVRARYDLRSAPPSAERLLEHIALLASEARDSVGAGRIAYEAAHFFLCYAH